jgi:hypothetical protein
MMGMLSSLLLAHLLLLLLLLLLDHHHRHHYHHRHHQRSEPPFFITVPVDCTTRVFSYAHSAGSAALEGTSMSTHPPSSADTTIQGLDPDDEKEEGGGGAGNAEAVPDDGRQQQQRCFVSSSLSVRKDRQVILVL